MNQPLSSSVVQAGTLTITGLTLTQLSPNLTLSAVSFPHSGGELGVDGRWWGCVGFTTGSILSRLWAFALYLAF